MFFSIAIISVLVFLLDSSKTCGNATAFCTVAIFLLVFLASMVMLLVLAFITGGIIHSAGKQQGGAVKYNSLSFFFLEDPNLKQVIVIPFGLAGVFGVSFLAVLANQPLLGIFGSGIILKVIFFYTNSAMPSIVVHGLYNGIVILLRSQKLGILASSPIKVPDVSIGFFDQEVANQFLTQILLVAPAEELFTIFMITVFLIFIKLKFNYQGLWPKVIAGGVSVSIWASYHNIISIS